MRSHQTFTPTLLRNCHLCLRPESWISRLVSSCSISASLPFCGRSDSGPTPLVAESRCACAQAASHPMPPLIRRSQPGLQARRNQHHHRKSNCPPLWSPAKIVSSLCGGMPRATSTFRPHCTPSASLIQKCCGVSALIPDPPSMPSRRKSPALWPNAKPSLASPAKTLAYPTEHYYEPTNISSRG